MNPNLCPRRRGRSGVAPLDGTDGRGGIGASGGQSGPEKGHPCSTHSPHRTHHTRTQALRRLLQCGVDDGVGAVGRILQGLGREVGVTLCHDGIIVAEDLLQLIEGSDAVDEE